jgi:single-stranded-DNA-specific exonuclease
MPALDNYPPLLATLLSNRGITDEEAAERFLYPNYERDIADPFGILNMERAVERILKAIRDKEKIIVYGDYDCDGIPGSVVMHDFFKKINYDLATNYIPHRHLEGYGLNIPAIDKFKSDGVTLIITVDCGIVDVAPVTHAQSLGIDVIVTDHHLPQAVLPPAYAVINSKQADDTYHDNMLCGAGVAWKLVTALLKRGNFADVPPGWEKWLLDMAGLSTIADMVPLVKENRAIAHFGLTVLRKSSRPGLQHLLRDAGTDQRRLTEEDVGFTIAPRINAASRMDVPFAAFEMLSSRDPIRSVELAKHLSKLNDERKSEVAIMMKEAKAHLKDRELRDVIVVGSPKWRIGIVGLAAGKIAEEFNRTTFVWGREGGMMIKGSCRSNGSVNLVDLMCAIDDGILINRGGHEMAGGFSVEHDGVHLLEDALNRVYAKVAKKMDSADSSKVIPEATLRLSDISQETSDLLTLLAPFGAGNPRPVFRFPNVTLAKVSQFGKTGDHLKLEMADASGARRSGIKFFASPTDFSGVSVIDGATVEVHATIEESYFRGRKELRLRIVDIV